MSHPFRAIVSGLLFLIPVLSSGFASVTIREIEFDLVNANERLGDWLECAIEVEVRWDSSDSQRQRPDYVDNLEVELLLGVEASGEGASRFEFYRSIAALVALKEGRHQVRFYLPPDVVERDRIRNDVHSYLVRLSRSGKIVEESVSRQLARSNVRESFLRRIEEESFKNDGILLAQFKTPFMFLYPSSTPTFRDLSGVSVKIE